MEPVGSYQPRQMESIILGQIVASCVNMFVASGQTRGQLSCWMQLGHYACMLQNMECAAADLLGMADMILFIIILMAIMLQKDWQQCHALLEGSDHACCFGCKHFSLLQGGRAFAESVGHAGSCQAQVGGQKRHP